jgi:3-(3-hydroxy-phenyl)propionate hydroxylase
VGELGALLLAREGLRVLALERQADMYSRPRVGVLDGEALRTLQKAGVYDRAAADMILGAGAQWASRHGQGANTTCTSGQDVVEPAVRTGSSARDGGGAISSALQASVAATAT